MFRWLAVALMLFVAAPSWALEVAIVDSVRALAETNEGKDVSRRLDTMYSTRKAEITRMSQEFETEVQDYQARQMILSEQARQETEAELGAKQERLYRTQMQYEQEMQQQYLQMVSGLQEKLMAVVHIIAKEQGIDLVMDKQATYYTGPNVRDITEVLIQRYDAASTSAPAP